MDQQQLNALWAEYQSSGGVQPSQPDINSLWAEYQQAKTASQPEVPARPKSFFGITPETIKAGPEKLTGYSARMNADAMRRWQNVLDTKARSEAGNSTLLEDAVQVGGQGIGLMFDAFGNAIGSVARYAPQPVKSVASNAFEEFARGAQQLGQYAGETMPQAGEALGNITDYVKQTLKQNPRLEADLAGVFNLAGAIPARGVGKAALEGGQYAVTPVGKALTYSGKVWSEAGKTQEAAKKANYVSDLVMPRVTPKIAEAQVGRTTQTKILKRNIVNPNQMEKQAIEEVSLLPGVKKSNSYQKNYNIINKVVEDEALALEDALKQSPVVFDQQAALAGMDNVNALFKKENIFIQAKKSEQRVADGVFEKAKGLISSNDNTPAGLLKARKELDRWARSPKRNVFESGQSAFSESLRKARDSINEMIVGMSPEAEVAASLKKQSNLLYAMDNIRPKAAREAKTMLGRTAKKASVILPSNNPVTNTLVGAGALTGLGLSGVGLPVAAVGASALTAYQAAKLLNNPAIKKGIGATLQTTGRVLTRSPK